MQIFFFCMESIVHSIKHNLHFKGNEALDTQEWVHEDHNKEPLEFHGILFFLDQQWEARPKE